MQIVRFKPTAAGGSQFETLEVPFPGTRDDDFGHTFRLSREFDANGIVVEIPAGTVQDWHPAPTRQLVVVLKGDLEVETTEGEVRRWGPGEIALADDVASKGHRTRVLGGAATLLFLRLPESFRLDDWTQPR